MPRQQIKKQEVDEVAMQAAIDDIKVVKYLLFERHPKSMVFVRQH